MNDPKWGGFQSMDNYSQPVPLRMVFIEGGTFVMGRNQENLMYEYDNIPRRVTVSSFYMDEFETSNQDYQEYLYWLQRIYGQDFPEVVRKAQPDDLVWNEVSSFRDALTDYFVHPSYKDYPVVGVTWEQATAFCHWRTQLEKNYNIYNDGYSVPVTYRLPTEAEWEYAARGGRLLAMYPWGGTYIRAARGCYLANFKPLRGDYSADGYMITAKVGSFPPNDFGLYDMAGNVAEWTGTAYHESNYSFVNDLNPNYQYNAKSTDPDVLRRKVIRGGSWKDIGYFLQNGVRTYEYQQEARSYIGQKPTINQK